VTGEALAQRITGFGHRGAAYAGSMADGVAKLAALAQPGDAVITLGAGSIWQAGEALLAVLRGAV
jgi:UDP-N-acetylmuramate--alanine ligase